MNCEIFICTFRRDFEYLKWCLRSIAKFATEFSGVTIVVPGQDYAELNRTIDSLYTPPTRSRLGLLHIRPMCGGAEWTDQGFLWHMWCIMQADQFVPARSTHIAHLDPDCVFTEPVTPERFCLQGKPVLRYEPYTTKIAKEPNIQHWYEAVNRALPFWAEYETMCGHPELYHMGLYKVARTLIEQQVGQPLDVYMKQCKNSYPQTFAEFPTLGAVALQCFPKMYYRHQMGSHPRMEDLENWPVFQAWSHNPPDVATNLWWRGEQCLRTPLIFYKEIGL